MSAFLSVTYGNFASFLVTLPLRSEKDVMWFLTRELELEAVHLSPQGAPTPEPNCPGTPGHGHGPCRQQGRSHRAGRGSRMPYNSHKQVFHPQEVD